MRIILISGLLAVSGTVSAWDLIESVDDFDGTTAHILQVESQQRVMGPASAEYTPVLQLRCDDSGKAAYWRVAWFVVVGTDAHVNSIIGVVEDINMRVRIDGDEDRRMLWDWSREDSFRAISTNRTPAVTRALVGAGELKLRIEGTLGEFHDATFDITGLGQSMTQLDGRCRRYD